MTGAKKTRTPSTARQSTAYSWNFTMVCRHPSGPPWGKWGFGGSGSGSWDDILPNLLERLGATIHQPLRHSRMGEFDPVYALHQIDGVVLPEPVELDNSAYTTYEEVRKAWEELEGQFRAANV